MKRREVKYTYIRYEPQSMIPADGWQAIFAYSHDDKFAHAHPLVAFVLTKAEDIYVYEDGEEEVGAKFMIIIGHEGSDLGITQVEDIANFVGYLEPGGSVSDWEETAREFCGREMSRRQTENAHRKETTDDRERD